ncbi:nucleoside hydrolase [Nocardia aurantia]|uniref:Pyrimidine-specific ribonucleoside hydrolase RihA n=1 Tax=Nocardia aurantia TaxID=2585199 RepID=A0A7K0DX14_9NOCA|nr:nucleoside hydrolase [Nocardia aurantia]MQY29374.1 Pyrimidine-specific ribonucleoside hydrolase RihA [Nocardia aurantia]
MGDIEDEANEPREPIGSAWSSLLGFADRYRALGFGPLADQLRGEGPPLPPLRGTPVIIDTDIGGDPDDAIAVTCAARAVPELALVLTADENGGRRARFARHLLDLLDRTEVPVVAGADLGNTRYYCVEDLIPAEVPAQPHDPVAAVHAVCATTDGPVRWVGMGPLSNLARILDTAPELAPRLVVTQMGGAIAYRDPTKAEHNFRLDPAAARFVVGRAVHLFLLLSDTTFTPEIEIARDSELYKRLATGDAPPWARLLTAHLDNWFDRFYPGTRQHDPLTLTAALQLPFVDFARRAVLLDDDARMTSDPGGRTVRTSARADYAAFRAWLAAQLDY